MKFVKLLVFALVAFVASFLIVSLSFGIINYHSELDLLLTNALIIDGVAEEAYRAEIGIKDEKIVAIGEELAMNSVLTYNLAGFTIAPAKVDWQPQEDWVERDLPSAIARYPLERLIITESPHEEWLKKSVDDLWREGLTPTEMALAKETKVKIVPKIDYEINDLVSAFYSLSGLRSELLKTNYGQIKVGYEPRLIVYNHRQLDEDEIFFYLQQGQMPPHDFFITGSQVLAIED